MDTLPLYLAIGALALIVAVDTILLLGVIRITSRLQREVSVITPVGAGRDAPDWEGRDLEGLDTGAQDYDGQLRVLLFVSPDCSACSTTLGELKLLNYKSRGNVVAICQGDAAACRPLLEPYLSVMRVILDETGQISARFDVARFPTAVLIDRDNKIRSYGHPEREAVESVMRGQAQESPMSLGMTIPR